MNIFRAQEVAAKYDRDLQATDPRFTSTVLLIHSDESYFKWRRAFIMSFAEEVLIVFSEHHGFHIFHKSDVTELYYYNEDKHTGKITLETIEVLNG